MTQDNWIPSGAFLPYFIHIATLQGVSYGDLAWGDYYNDGDLDILLSGLTSNNITRISKIYRNDGSDTFTETVSLTGIWHGSVTWWDYDNDDDLDILLTGDTGSGYISYIYRNNRFSNLLITK